MAGHTLAFIGKKWRQVTMLKGQFIYKKSVYRIFFWRFADFASQYIYLST